MALEQYQLDRQIALIRRLTNEPEEDAKYDADELREHIEAAFQVVLQDLQTDADNPILCRFTVQPAPGTDYFILPPGVGVVKRVAKINTRTGIPDWTFVPESEWAWWGPGLRLEGRTLRFDPKWTGESQVLEVLYVPNGDVRLHRGWGTLNDNTMTLANQPDRGEKDGRENAYLGSVIRIFNDGRIFERTITGQTNDTAVSFEGSTGLTNGTYAYEIVPVYGRLVEMVVATYVARQLRAAARDAVGVSLLDAEYRRVRRAARLQLSRMQGIVSDRFEHDTGQVSEQPIFVWR